MSENQNTINFIMSADLGNGFVKGYIHGDNKYFIIPSLISKLSPQSKNNSDKQSESQSIKLVKNYSKYIDVKVTSSALKNENNNQRRLIGNNAENEPVLSHGFNPGVKDDKSKSDLSIILIDGIIAAKSIEHYTSKYNKAPEKDITVNVGLVTALPILEGVQPGIGEKYEKRFTDNSHDVKICNISKDNHITIHINFNKVYVLLEDAISVFKIRRDASQGMKESIKKSAISQLEKNSTDAKAYWSKNNSYENLMNKLNISLAIDVGEKTTDLAVLNGEKPSNDSTSVYCGLGNIINKSLRDGNFSHNTPISFIKLLLEDTAGMSFEEKGQQRARNEVNKNSDALIRQITGPINRLIHNHDIRIVYVYGGGSIILRNLLQDKLHQLIPSRPIVFIDEKYTQYMNLLGLRAVADALVGAHRL